MPVDDEDIFDELITKQEVNLTHEREKKNAVAEKCIYFTYTIYILLSFVSFFAPSSLNLNYGIKLAIDMRVKWRMKSKNEKSYILLPSTNNVVVWNE